VLPVVAVPLLAPYKDLPASAEAGAAETAANEETTVAKSSTIARENIFFISNSFVSYKLWCD
jgi:hypothetical protein